MNNDRHAKRARALFESGTLACDCSAPDVGVGVMHEPYCASNGYPKPDDIATAIGEAVDEALADSADKARADVALVVVEQLRDALKEIYEQRDGTNVIVTGPGRWRAFSAPKILEFLVAAEQALSMRP